MRLNSLKARKHVTHCEPSADSKNQIGHVTVVMKPDAYPEHHEQVRAHARAHGLEIREDVGAPKDAIKLRGTIGDLEKAFDTGTRECQSIFPASDKDRGVTAYHKVFRTLTKDIGLPDELHGKVTAVLGLDTYPIARPHFHVKREETPAELKLQRMHPKEVSMDGVDSIEQLSKILNSFTPRQVAHLYKFPINTLGGGGVKVGVLELGGGYSTDDLKTYFDGIGLKTHPTVTTVPVDGGSNTPGGDADGEVMLDIEVIGAIANGCDIRVYFAPNTDQGFYDAIAQALQDGCQVLSVSWGGPEDSWSQQSINAINQICSIAAPKMTITVAAGDDGYLDGEQNAAADFPASSPWVLACGGTRLKATADKILAETTWNDLSQGSGGTGGGISRLNIVPPYQKGLTYQTTASDKAIPLTGRGLPDVAGLADPQTGYIIRVQGSNQVIGGTSAVAPLWAALIAFACEKKKVPLGFINAELYTVKPPPTNDIPSGDNGLYKSVAGWDACTGWGSPNGETFMQVFG